MIDLSVIVPTFNAKAGAHATVERLYASLAATDLQTEIVLVDDGSRVKQRPDPSSIPAGIRVVQLDRNHGKGFAVRAGLAASSGRVRIFTDVDLPYGTESMLECYERLNRGDADIVYGDRSLPQSKTISSVRKRRRFSSLAFRGAVLAIAGIRQGDTQCGIKGIRGGMAAAMLPLLRVDGFAFDVEIFRCARDNDLTIAPMAVHLANSDDSTVRLIRDSATMLRDLIAIRLRSAGGQYRLRTAQLSSARVVDQA